MKLLKWIKSIFKKPVVVSPVATSPTRETSLVFKGMYPKAQAVPGKKPMKARGKYKGDFPEGLIIHFTAGQKSQSGSGMIQFANENAYLFYFMDEKGQVFQQFNANEWGNHAGVSKCPVTGRTDVSKIYAGIEIANGGRLDPKTKKTWFGKVVSNPRYFKGNKLQTEGWYEPYTEEQEASLIEFCLWMCKNGVRPDLILGHDEVAPSRKNDPGGALSVSMEVFRARIKQRLIESNIAF